MSNNTKTKYEPVDLINVYTESLQRAADSQIESIEYSKNTLQMRIKFNDGSYLGYTGKLAEKIYKRMSSKDVKPTKANAKGMPVFVSLVNDMREKQKQYFKDKGKDTLQWAKAAEKKVDNILEKFTNPTMFKQ